MDANELKERIENLSIWKKGDQRAPHKPLLILYALGRLQDKSTRFISYKEIRDKLKKLLKDFGPVRKSYHPEDPFVRLYKDGIWSFSVKKEDIRINDKWLLNNGVTGGFNDDVYSLLTQDKKLVREIGELILNKHFPDTIHEDILIATGLNIEKGSKRVRDPKFRDMILRAYEHRCAVCGFSVRLRDNLVGVEASHIKWHQYGGPDCEENGIALCAMHHKLFDRGVFAITDSREIAVSEEAHGNSGFDEWLMRYHGKAIRTPINPEYQPKNSYIAWHIKEVFRGPGRYRVG